MDTTERITITIDGNDRVSGLQRVPDVAHACCVLAHGAGAGMSHPFMAAVSDGLAKRGIATLRFQFPYMERGSKRPDTPMIADATIRAAVAEAARRWPRLPLFAGGKSFGGRMTSQAQALDPLPGVCGLVFFGFPLHPAGKPSDSRAAHLSRVRVPMLFVQGTRDKLAAPELLLPVIDRLGPRASLHKLDGADHSFHVLARGVRTNAEVLCEALDACVAWFDRCIESTQVSVAGSV
ncbi:alpha/beta family hydrolase [Dokdonella sp.]|uniref:alpha/beta hydrolase family protein n=1 Tax=Dokdonella sp. TaxID=2291710 RepID=UPI003783C604